MIRELGCGKCGTGKPQFQIFIDADDSDKFNIRDVTDLRNNIGEFYLIVIECRKCGNKTEIIMGSD